MDFQRFKEINDSRLNYREMDDATVVSNYRNTGCGDGYRIYLKIQEDRIVDASYTTTGCGFGITALAMATLIVKDKSLEEAENLNEEDIEKEFSFPEKRKNYPKSAIMALRQALKDYREGAGVPKEKRITGTKALEILKTKGSLAQEDLSSVILEKENFTNVSFEGANLHNAFLQNNNFSGANFSGTNLRGAFLNNSDLRNANFRGADLRWAKLTGTKIEGADFTDALYDIGTRVDSKNLVIFDVMKKVGKDLYVKQEDA
jgi:uncharacterized protein YjbI with pentapeptide repeats